ncbi:NYN domain-containing protein [Actinomyces bovis]|uniref:NYN domain-containing protein n=1 Tax=Actinomyces bovis TaxID=1658 RepID=UPI0018D57083|nr:NYN domain-containing protein [Actinomyces bovis]
MERFALLVDAGYFWAAGGMALAGQSLQRHRLRMRNPAKAVSDLVEEARECGDAVSLLRTYWYDAIRGNEVSGGLAELAALPSLKLRLGALNGAGQQKGVDSLIVTDLIELARNRAVSDIVLMSGDEDIRVGVQLAQTYGLRIHLLGIGDLRTNSSRTLQQEADTVVTLSPEWLETHLEVVQTEPGQDPHILSSGRTSAHRVELEAVDGESLGETALRVTECVISSMDERDREQLLSQIDFGGSIPRTIDGLLIGSVSRLQGNSRLTPDQLRAVRSTFKSALRG